MRPRLGTRLILGVRLELLASSPMRQYKDVTYVAVTDGLISQKTQQGVVRRTSIARGRMDAFPLEQPLPQMIIEAGIKGDRHGLSCLYVCHNW
jgi:hypothetical protein